MRSAIDGGINFLDNCWDYNDGASEVRMGKALKDGYREKAFLMTKIDGRSKKKRPGSWKNPFVVWKSTASTLYSIMKSSGTKIPSYLCRGGSTRGPHRGPKAGKIRYIGFTGHKDPRVHLYMLEVADKFGFKFDTVQMPLNLMDAHYRSFAKQVVPELVSRHIGVLGMKSMANGILLKSNTVTRSSACTTP